MKKCRKLMHVYADELPGCPECRQEWLDKNREKLNAQVRDWNQKNPERKREIQRAYRLKSYNLTIESFEQLKAKQGGGCAICGRQGDLVVDHDHRCCPDKATSCGKCVRGLLCDGCNRGLGYLNDSPEILQLAASYLRNRVE